MPSNAKKGPAVTAVTKDELLNIPRWGRQEYRHKQGILAQILENVTKLEGNIANLRNMQQAGQCPRALQVNIKVTVNAAQQGDVDNALEEAKKTFHNRVMETLITAREKELAGLKQEADKKVSDFQQYLTTNFQALKDNDILKDTTDEEIHHEIMQSMVTFQKRAEDSAQNIKTQHFFAQKKQKEQDEAREVAEAEANINNELLDPQVQTLQQRLTALEKKIPKLNPNTTPKPNKPNKTKPKAKETPKRGNKKMLTQGGGKNPKPHSKKANQNPQKPNNTPSDPNEARPRGKPGADHGNQGRKRRFTNTTSRSESKPRNSRQRRN